MSAMLQSPQHSAYPEYTTEELKCQPSGAQHIIRILGLADVARAQENGLQEDVSASAATGLQVDWNYHGIDWDGPDPLMPL